MSLKPIEWLGDSRDRVRDWPKSVRYRAGLELRALQTGSNASDWKPFTAVGLGVIEIRIRTGDQYRIFTVTKFGNAIVVLHAFMKKSQKTSLADIELARRRYAELKETRT
jgi:phage-related protein